MSERPLDVHDAHPRASRRELLKATSCGFGYLALAGVLRDAGLLGRTAHAADAAPPGGPGRRPTLDPRSPHFAPRAKRVIFLFMQGGPSQVDTFDPKPRLTRQDGESVPFHVARTRQITPEKLMRSPWSFRRHGDSGQWVSELFPHVARHVDDLCILRGMHTEGVAHGPATLALHTGATSLVRPSMGSWIVYGLGTENRSLPGFVTISPTARMGGPRNYSSAFLPTIYQGTPLGRAGLPATEARIRDLTNDAVPRSTQRRRFALLQELNGAQLRRAPTDDALESVVTSFELAYRMQAEAPGLFDLAEESAATRRLYGIGEKETDEFGRQCLLARRLAEAGVRYIQVNYSDNGNNPKWDQHSKLIRHADHARATDLPVAGLLTDLKARGLLEDTLLWWGGEFGRTPFSQNKDGRDHNPRGFTVWLAGAGVRPGLAWGETDEFGYEAIDGRVHMHDLHATVLHLLGLDHERLLYRYAGRDFRLTDVYGEIVREILV